jgi:hypothetical protein
MATAEAHSETIPFDELALALLVGSDRIPADAVGRAAVIKWKDLDQETLKRYFQAAEPLALEGNEAAKRFRAAYSEVAQAAWKEIVVASATDFIAQRLATANTGHRDADAPSTTPASSSDTLR